MLVSCGFHLREPMPLAPSLYQLYLETNDPYGQLTRSLRTYLKMSGVHLVSSKDKAKTILEILQEETSQQLLSVSGTQQTRQYNLVLTVTFQVSNAQNQVIVPPQTVRETTVLTMQSNQILASSNQTSLLYQNMRRNAAADMMNRLSSQEITALIAPHFQSTRSP